MKHIKLFEEFINEADEQNLSSASEADQLAYIKRNSAYGTALDKIEDPSETVQIAAVKKNPQELQYIKDPSEKVQLLAVTQDSHKLFKRGYSPAGNYDNAIQWIKDPSEKVQLAAVTKFGYAIQNIEDPSEKVQLAAVTADPTAIQYIKDPSEKVQLACMDNLKKVQGDLPSDVLAMIEDPTAKVQKLWPKD